MKAKMNSIKHLEYQQCRICYNSTDNLQLLTNIAELSTSQAAQKTYAQLLLEVCNINIMEDNPLGQWPSFICFNCSHKLKLTYDFIQHTHKINQLLKSIANLLETKNDSNYIEAPELDIPLEIKIENNDVLDVIPSERKFQYSPVESEIIKAEAILNCDDNLIDISSNCYDENSKETTVQSTSTFTACADFDNLLKENLNESKSNTKTVFNCSECNKSFTSVHNLNRHKRCFHTTDGSKRSCPICDIKFSRSDYLKRHLQTVHKPNRDKMKNMTKKSNSNKDDAFLGCNEKIKLCNDVISLTCNVCKKIFNTQRKLSRHKRFVHIPEEKKITCDFCGNKFGRTDHYKRHMKCLHGVENGVPKKNLVEIKDNRFSCDKCNRSYSRRYRLFRHEREVHGK